MYAVGVDVSNGKSSVTVLRSKREVIMPPFDVTHTTEGLAALVEKMGGLRGNLLACGLRGEAEPEGVHGALPQVAQATRL